MIPEFKNTEDAVTYGKAILGNYSEIEILKITEKCVSDEILEARKKKEIQLEFNLAVKLEFIHEAIEAAEEENQAIAPADAHGCGEEL